MMVGVVIRKCTNSERKIAIDKDKNTIEHNLGPASIFFSNFAGRGVES